jgi:hypothetical protein
LKNLIVSPQAGMCNRFRAINSTLLLAQLSERQAWHNWTREPAHPRDQRIIQHMRSTSLDDFFEVDGIAYMELNQHSPVDAVFSEWDVTDYWYPVQCSAISRCNKHSSLQVERETADPILSCQANTILLETSLALQSTSMTVAQAHTRRAAIYQRCFKAKSVYQEAADQVIKNQNFVGVHIRRTDHLTHVKEAHIALQGWANIIQKHIATDMPIFLFSDDLAFKAALSEQLVQPLIAYNQTALLRDFSDYEVAFIEFLMLSKARHIFGTVASSFSAEAALFGGINLSTCRADFEQ